jgi:hypothetical protein
LIVEEATQVGTLADAPFCEITVASVAPDTVTPCRASRRASMVLAVASRLATVPSGR